jgi:hypothetical protein
MQQVGVKPSYLGAKWESNLHIVGVKPSYLPVEKWQSGSQTFIFACGKMAKWESNLHICGSQTFILAGLSRLLLSADAA